MVKRVTLMERLDSAAATPLRNELASAEGDDLVLVGTPVEFLGGLCLELLMCARQVWSAAGKTLTIEDASEAFCDNLSRFGLQVSDLSTGGVG